MSDSDKSVSLVALGRCKDPLLLRVGYVKGDKSLTFAKKLFYDDVKYIPVKDWTCKTNINTIIGTHTYYETGVYPKLYMCNEMFYLELSKIFLVYRIVQRCMLGKHATIRLTDKIMKYLCDYY